MTKTIGFAVIVIGAAWCLLVAGCAQPPKEITLDLGNNVTMKLVLIPSGKFMMGSPENEKGRNGDNEGPQREVTLSKPFYMGIYEVTQEQYEQVMGKNPSGFKGAKNPVEVAWDYAVEFCKKLSAATGASVRLPTEAEWEYACRAGSKTRFSYGDDDDKLDDYAWYDRNSNNKTHPVGQKKPNHWGLYDMHGNVWEWCSDCYADFYGNANNTPTDPASGRYRVLRGGSWGHPLHYCRSAARLWNAHDMLSNGYGFRVVVDLK